MKSKKIKIMLFLIIIMLGISTISNAALESRPGKGSWSATANNQFTSIRAMEKSGGTLGLNATIDGTTYLDTTGNGLDVHMVLATECGTAAILAVSDYGAFNTNGVVSDAGTTTAATTGNITGVFQMANSTTYAGYEYMSGIIENGSNQYTSTIYSADSRYYNLYTSDSTTYHKGDAIYQTRGWYSGTTSYVTTSAPIYRRSKGLFGFGSFDGACYNNGVDFHYARAAITCAEGL